MRDCAVMAGFRLTEFKNLFSFEKFTESGHVIEIIQQSIKYLQMKHSKVQTVCVQIKNSYAKSCNHSSPFFLTRAYYTPSDIIPVSYDELSETNNNDDQDAVGNFRYNGNLKNIIKVWMKSC